MAMKSKRSSFKSYVYGTDAKENFDGEKNATGCAQEETVSEINYGKNYKKKESSKLKDDQSVSEQSSEKDPNAKTNKGQGELEESVSPVPSPRTKRNMSKLSGQKGLPKPTKPPPPVPVTPPPVPVKTPPPVAVKPKGRRGLNRSQTQTPKDISSVNRNADGETTPEFLRVKLKSASGDQLQQSYTTDDVDDIKRLSQEATPTPPMRHKNYPSASTPSSGQSSQTGQLSKRISYTTDDLDKMSALRSVGGHLKKEGTVKPKAAPKPLKSIGQFAKRGARAPTPEHDKNHHVVDSSDSKSAPKSHKYKQKSEDSGLPRPSLNRLIKSGTQTPAQKQDCSDSKSAPKLKSHKNKQKSEDSGSPTTKPRSKSLTHVFNRKVNDDGDKTRAPLQKTENIYDIDTSSCDSLNSAIKLRSESDPVGNIEDSFDSACKNRDYDDVYVGDAEAEDSPDDETQQKKKSMKLLDRGDRPIRSPPDFAESEPAFLHNPHLLDIGALHDDEGFSTHEYSSFDEMDDSFDSSSDSDRDNSVLNSENTDLSSVPVNTSAMQQVLQDIEEDCAGMDPLQRKAHELLVTERGYVKKLKLIDQTFQFRIEMENKKHNMFPDEVINQMFANIKSIYQLHSEHLLPKLEQRMKNWETEGRIGDILVTFAPFLKMYSEYIKNYDTGTTLITNWSQKCPRFKAIIDELQSLPDCGHLALQHHMLNPIQRVPRYELLLKDYLKLVPEDSDDRALTQKALDVVTTAACHSNEAMKKIDKFRKVLDVHDRIGGSITDLVSPTRELIKEGKVMKVSRRKGALLERHLFLFNDLLLVCEQGINLIRSSYSVRDKLSIDGMKVDPPGTERDSVKDSDLLIFEGDNPEVKYTFRVKSKEKVLEFSASGLEEKDEWQAKLWNVVQDFSKKKSSLRPDDRLYDTGISEEKIGMEAPVWVRDNSASMCMVCSLEFKAFRRRHHCRACGILVCNRCSDFRTKLQFDDKIHRVCKRCHDIIIAKGVSYAGGEDVEITSGGSSQTTSGRTPPKVKPGILQIKADDPSVMSGILKVSTDGGKTWNKRWFAVHTDFVLYSFKAKRDVAATSTTPLPGFQVKDIDEEDDIAESNVFKLCHTRLTYFYHAPSTSAKKRWMDVLSRVVKAEIPTICMDHPEPEPESSEAGPEACDFENDVVKNDSAPAD